MRTTRLLRITVTAAAALMLAPLAVFAQPAPPSGLEGHTSPQLVDQSPEFATLRAKYENMTLDQLTVAGYEATPDCVSSPFGGMGYHAVNGQAMGAQFPTGTVDQQMPPIVLLDANMRVVGVEWESSKNAPAPTIFGYKPTLQPPHPGVDEDHYMVHAYFKPNNQVLFGVFDPDLKCPANSEGGPPTGMPMTGNFTPEPLAVPLAIVAGLALLATGATLRRRKA